MVLARAVTSYQNHSGLSLSAAAAFFLVVSKNKDSVDSVDVKTVSGIQGHCHVACSNLRSTQLSALAEHFVAWVASHLELAPGFALFHIALINILLVCSSYVLNFARREGKTGTKFSVFSDLGKQTSSIDSTHQAAFFKTLLPMCM